MSREPPAAQPKSRAARADGLDHLGMVGEVEVVAAGEEQHLAPVDRPCAAPWAPSSTRMRRYVPRARIAPRRLGRERLEAGKRSGRGRFALRERVRAHAPPHLGAQDLARRRRRGGSRSAPRGARRAARRTRGCRPPRSPRRRSCGRCRSPRRRASSGSPRRRASSPARARAAPSARRCPSRPRRDAHLGARVHEAHHREHAQRALGRERAVRAHRVALDRDQEVHRDARHLELAQLEGHLDHVAALLAHADDQPAARLDAALLRGAQRGHAVGVGVRRADLRVVTLAGVEVVVQPVEARPRPGCARAPRRAGRPRGTPRSGGAASPCGSGRRARACVARRRAAAREHHAVARGAGLARRARPRRGSPPRSSSGTCGSPRRVLATASSSRSPRGRGRSARCSARAPSPCGRSGARAARRRRGAAGSSATSGAVEDPERLGGVGGSSRRARSARRV